MGSLRVLEALRRLLSPKDDTFHVMTTTWMTLRDDHRVDDAPRSGHRTCSSSIVNRHQTKFVITSGVIATPLRHPLRGHHTRCVKETFSSLFVSNVKFVSIFAALWK